MTTVMEFMIWEDWKRQHHKEEKDHHHINSGLQVKQYHRFWSGMEEVPVCFWLRDLMTKPISTDMMYARLSETAYYCLKAWESCLRIVKCTNSSFVLYFDWAWYYTAQSSLQPVVIESNGFKIGQGQTFGRLCYCLLFSMKWDTKTII